MATEITVTDFHEGRKTERQLTQACRALSSSEAAHRLLGYPIYQTWSTHRMMHFRVPEWLAQASRECKDSNDGDADEETSSKSGSDGEESVQSDAGNAPRGQYRHGHNQPRSSRNDELLAHYLERPLLRKYQVRRYKWPKGCHYP